MRKGLLATVMLLLILLALPAASQDDGSGYYARGIELFETCDWKNALTAFLDAIDCRSDVPEYHYYAGLSWMQLQTFDKADQELRWAMHYGKGTPTAVDAYKYYVFLQRKDPKVIPAVKAGYLYLGINPNWLWLRMVRPEIYDITLPERYGVNKQGKLYKFEELYYQVTGLGDRIISIQTWNPELVTDRGVKIGHEVGDALKAYGTGYRLEGIEKNENIATASWGILHYDSMGIAFMVRDGKVARFIVYEPGDYRPKSPAPAPASTPN